MKDKRRYRRIYVRLWSDPDFLALDDASKVLTLYALTGPQSNRIGIFRFSLAEALEVLGRPTTSGPWWGGQAGQGAIRDAFDVLCQTFGWEFDERARVLWIPSWWDYNRPANPNVLEAALRGDMADLPRTELLERFWTNVDDLPAGEGERDSFRERFEVVRRSWVAASGQRSGKRSG